VVQLPGLGPGEVVHSTILSFFPMIYFMFLSFEPYTKTKGVQVTRKRTSPIWLKSKQELQGLLDKCSTFVEVLKELGLDAYSGNHRTLKERIKQDSLNIEKLNEKRKELYKKLNTKRLIPLSEIMIENSTFSTNHLKRRLIKEKILEYKCERCNNYGVWMREKLVLQLEHKNGNSRDHRLDNVCFLYSSRQKTQSL